MSCEVELSNVIEVRIIESIIDESKYSNDMKTNLKKYINELVDIVNKKKIKVIEDYDFEDTPETETDEEWCEGGQISKYLIVSNIVYCLCSFLFNLLFKNI